MAWRLPKSNQIMLVVGTELKLLGYVAGIYFCFIYWGYLQEKLTSTEYKNSRSPSAIRWDYAYSLNFLMALSAVVVASVAELFQSNLKRMEPFAFARAALSCAAASPLGYAALKYISFPLMVLTKSSKPVPVMIIGVLFFRKKYTWYKYLSVFLLCGGCVLFSSTSKSKSKGTSPQASLYEQLFGVFLVGINLFLDGYTNNEQDLIFKAQQASGPQMMKYINIWQAIYLLVYLVFFWCIYGEDSELEKSIRAWVLCPDIRWDILLFCICAGFGQILIFGLMKDFGSLVWVTVSITRKLFTIVVSVIMFNHQVKLIQWLGIALVFGGMSLDIIMNYVDKHHSANHGKKNKPLNPNSMNQEAAGEMADKLHEKRA